MKVFLNPGHAFNGDPDPGATNMELGIRESDIAKEVTDLVEKYLVAAGVEVVGNVQDDYLTGVINKANATDADIFISIHCNSHSNSSASGTETWNWYESSRGEALAQCIQSQIVDALGTVDRGVKQSAPGHNSLGVLKYTRMTAVLVELAFISNYNDAQLLINNADDFARAIARGVTDYQNL